MALSTTLSECVSFCIFLHTQLVGHEARHGYVEESLLQAPDPLFLVY